MNNVQALERRVSEYTPEQIALIKRTVAQGTSDDELRLFLEVCRMTGLNPFTRQIHAVMRTSRELVNGQWTNTKKMVIQTGIDGFRLQAARTGLHVGTSEPEFGPLMDADPERWGDGRRYPEWCKVVVHRLVPQTGAVADFPAVAYFEEYAQTTEEYRSGQRTGRAKLNSMWSRMPRGQLAKCAEALALRKAFPAELSGLYSHEEMQQAGEPLSPIADVSSTAQIVAPPVQVRAQLVAPPIDVEPPPAEPRLEREPGEDDEPTPAERIMAAQTLAELEKVGREVRDLVNAAPVDEAAAVRKLYADRKRELGGNGNGGAK